MSEVGSEEEAGLNPETDRSEIEEKITKLLQGEQSFSGTKYGGLDLESSALSEWEDRPVIDQSREPLHSVEDIRVILMEQEAREIKTKKGSWFKKTEELKKIAAFKSVQLHISPEGEPARVKHVYILNLTEGESPKLTSYINKPAWSLMGEGELSPMLPFNMVTTEASAETLKAFNQFLDEGKPISEEKP